jgi:hypothetical protein
MEIMKRLLVAAVILAVVVVMALRGCPRARRHADAARPVLACRRVLHPVEIEKAPLRVLVFDICW